MYYLAQVNIARMLAPLSDPIMADFVAQLEPINALADNSPGFIWRLQTSEGNAVDIQPYEDEMILVNMSVWTTLDDLANYAYASGARHRDVMKQRRRWFERTKGPYTTLWWVPQGHIPTVAEAKERLEHLRQHGETAYAFSFKKPFPAPDNSSEPLTQQSEPCPA
jgi:hypothetical protein